MSSSEDLACITPPGPAPPFPSGAATGRVGSSISRDKSPSQGTTGGGVACSDALSENDNPSLGNFSGAGCSSSGTGIRLHGAEHSISSSMALTYDPEKSDDDGSDLDLAAASTSSVGGISSNVPLVTKGRSGSTSAGPSGHSCSLVDDDGKRVRHPILTHLNEKCSQSGKNSKVGFTVPQGHDRPSTSHQFVSSSVSQSHSSSAGSQHLHSSSASHNSQVLHVIDMADVIEDAIEETMIPGDELVPHHTAGEGRHRSRGHSSASTGGGGRRHSAQARGHLAATSSHHSRSAGRYIVERSTHRTTRFDSLDETSNSSGASDGDSVNNTYLVQYMTQEPIVIRGNGNLTLFGLSNGFSTQFPSTLLGRVSREEFEATINGINDLLREHQSTNARILLLGCLCCCCSFGCSLLWPTLSLSKRTRTALEKMLAHENSRLYHKLNLNWRLAKQTSHTNHAFMEYILLIEFMPKYNIFQPD